MLGGLSIKSNFFDEIFSISVIEHIKDGKTNGDSEMMKECILIDCLRKEF